MQKTNLARNTIMLSVGTMLTKGINLLMIPLFSAWLSTEDYGTFDLLATYVSLLIPFVSLSSSDAIFRFAIEKDTDSERKPIVSSGLLINVINTVIVVIALLIIRQTTHWVMAVPFVFLFISELLNNHLQGFARATKQLTAYSFSSVISTIGIAVFVTVFVLFRKLGLLGMVYGYACGYYLGCFFLILSTKYLSFIDLRSIKISIIKKMVGYALPLVPNNISWWIIGVSDRTFINIFLGAAANGIYAIAYKIPNLCASVFNVFSISWQETAVELVDSDTRDTYYNQVYNSTISIIISLCGGLLAINFFLFNYIFNFRYIEGMLYSPILISSAIFSSLSQYFGGIQISLKKTTENGLTTVSGAITNIVIDLALIKYIGLYAAAISTIVANFTVCYLRYVRLRREISFSISKKTIAHIIYYIYMFGMCYINNVYVAAMNFVFATIMFLIINNAFVKKINKKLCSVIRR
ncbi:MAG: oligosaccharide flippase family protein [Lachnospiraceae bacterium]|nr:oligosaccharide flippase family protein [Lachnospiraceae bacterium]